MPGERLDDLELQRRILEALPDDLGLSPMAGFKMDLSANPDFRKVFFSATCGCGTSALLSLEVAREKSPDEIEAALPSLIDGLERQAKQFRSMSCDLHTRMRLGPMADRQARGRERSADAT